MYRNPADRLEKSCLHSLTQSNGGNWKGMSMSRETVTAASSATAHVFIQRARYRNQKAFWQRYGKGNCISAWSSAQWKYAARRSCWPQRSLTFSPCWSAIRGGYLHLKWLWIWSGMRKILFIPGKSLSTMPATCGRNWGFLIWCRIILKAYAA